MLPDKSRISIRLVWLPVDTTDFVVKSARGLSSSMVTDSVVGVVAIPSDTFTGSAIVLISSADVLGWSIGPFSVTV